MPPELETESTATENTSTETNTETTESTSTETASTEGAEGTQTEGSETSTEEGAAGDSAGKSPTAWKPNTKFKADDKEHEIPKELSALIKDEATEKQIVELLQKSYGLDAVKGRAETVRQQRDEFKGKLSTYDKAIEDLRGHYKRGDLDMWMEKLQVDPNKFLKWALDKVNYSQLTPEQRQQKDAEIQSSRRAYELEQQNVQLQSENRDTTVQAMQTQLNYEFGRPEVSKFQEQFDKKANKPGAFFEAVRQKGQSTFTLSGGQKNMTPAEAVAEVMKDYAGFIQDAGGTQANPNAPKVVQPNQAQKTTIPNVQGKQSSPVGTPKPKNLKELRELANKANA
jgi:hypothetical protein